jgi:hypothetical protein
MAEAAKGTSEAQKYMEQFAEDDPREWLARWMKQQDMAGAPPDPDDMPEEWLEQWYRMMGVVPRSRYLKLLERHEKLRQELEEARAKIDRMRGESGSGASSKSADEMMDMWTSALDETLKAQSEWMQSFMEQSDTSDEETKPGGSREQDGTDPKDDSTSE